jgi:hypothetical protein
MIYMLTVILVLVGAAASAIVIIAMWDAGATAWRRWRQRQSVTDRSRGTTNHPGNASASISWEATKSIA